MVQTVFPSNDQFAISTDGLSKKYGENYALNDVSLRVPVGSIFGFIGPNGSGKTTLIRILVDLIRATSGTARVFGRDSRHEGVNLRKDIGYLPGNLVLPPRLNGLQFLSDIAKVRQLDLHNEILQLADRLDAELHRPMGDLSLGNRRKVGMIAAFMHKPKLLILDEPTGGLDPLVQQSFRQMTREAANDGRTVFLSSHVLDEVQHVSDRVAVVRQGQVISQGRVEDLTEKLVRHFHVTFSHPLDPAMFQAVKHVHGVATGPHPSDLVFTVAGEAGPLIEALGHFEVVDLRGAEPDLEDVFLQMYSTKPA
jgi:ABC-2 type transport system ATP-binding protein